MVCNLVLYLTCYYVVQKRNLLYACQRIAYSFQGTNHMPHHNFEINVGMYIAPVWIDVKCRQLFNIIILFNKNSIIYYCSDFFKHCTCYYKWYFMINFPRKKKYIKYLNEILCCLLFYIFLHKSTHLLSLTSIRSVQYYQSCTLATCR